MIIYLQEKHNLELDELRKAGHEALAIIVEEFKVNIFTAKPLSSVCGGS